MTIVGGWQSLTVARSGNYTETTLILMDVPHLVVHCSVVRNSPGDPRCARAKINDRMRRLIEQDGTVNTKEFIRWFNGVCK